MLTTPVRTASLSVLLFATAIVAPAWGQTPEIVVTAKPPPDLMRRVVKTSDLNLATPAGQRELQRRVEAAVQSLCKIPAPIAYYEQVMNEPCRKEAWAGAQPQIDRQMKRTTPAAPRR